MVSFIGHHFGRSPNPPRPSAKLRVPSVLGFVRGALPPGLKALPPHRCPPLRIGSRLLSQAANAPRAPITPRLSTAPPQVGATYRVAGFLISSDCSSAPLVPFLASLPSLHAPVKNRRATGATRPAATALYKEPPPPSVLRPCSAISPLLRWRFQQTHPTLVHKFLFQD